jgi:hypothetical protein
MSLLKQPIFLLLPITELTPTRQVVRANYPSSLMKCLWLHARIIHTPTPSCSWSLFSQLTKRCVVSLVQENFPANFLDDDVPRVDRPVVIVLNFFDSSSMTIDSNRLNCFAMCEVASLLDKSSSLDRTCRCDQICRIAKNEVTLSSNFRLV